jgi:hypothetical protein
MKMWSLDETAMQDLSALPETGMGFQLVESLIWGRSTILLIFNCELAVELSEIGLEPGDDPMVILRNGLRIIETLRNDDVVMTMVSAPAPRSFRLLNARIGPLPSTNILTANAAITAALPSSLIKHDKLKSNRAFHRFSAFNPDRRVDPITGSFLAGTYAAPASEVPFVPTGFVAVGRFALPNNLPASFHYEIEAPTGTLVDFGTVAPAFGQAGGGVEAYFANAVTNATVSPAHVTKLPDE